MKDTIKCDKCGNKFQGFKCPKCGYDWLDPYDIDKFMRKIYDAKLNLVTGFDVNAYYDLGVIKKDDLIDGAYYQGNCRNASIAQWDAKNNCFWYMRDKFGHVYKEDINHLADDNGYDLFIPFQKVDDKDARNGDKIK